jgi:hypothetical protein
MWSAAALCRFGPHSGAGIPLRGCLKSCRGLQHSKTLREEFGLCGVRQPSAALVPTAELGSPSGGARKAVEDYSTPRRFARNLGYVECGSPLPLWSPQRSWDPPPGVHEKL